MFHHIYYFMEYFLLALVAIFFLLKWTKNKAVSEKEMINNDNIVINKTPNYVTGSFIDNEGNYTVGVDVYEAESLSKFSSFKKSNYTVNVIEQKCPKCNVWLAHHFYGKYRCSNCGYIDIYREVE